MKLMNDGIDIGEWNMARIWKVNWKHGEDMKVNWKQIKKQNF